MELNTPAAKFFGPKLARCLDFLYVNRVKCESSHLDTRILASCSLMLKDLYETASSPQNCDTTSQSQKALGDCVEFRELQAGSCRHRSLEHLEHMWLKGCKRLHPVSVSPDTHPLLAFQILSVELSPMTFYYFHFFFELLWPLLSTEIFSVQS